MSREHASPWLTGEYPAGAEESVDSGSGGGGAAVGVGDYAYWRRSTPFDVDTGTFDYTADLLDSRGTSVAGDVSAPWIASFGYAAIKITEDGVYRIEATADGDALADAINVGISHVDSAGVTVDPAPLARSYTFAAAGEFPTVHYETVRFCSAGDHIDINNGGSLITLAIQVHKIA